jgi:putative spermidine/putrescine transport system ATP-binding protein
MATLSLQSVTRRFGAVAAVDNVSLEVAAGEFVCLLGPSGCGKSTALRLVGGFEDPDGGDILIDGASTVAIPPNRRATGMVFQSHALWSHMTVFGNIAFGLKLRKLPGAVVQRKVQDALTLLGLDGLEKRYPRQLSGGQQQRVALARSLVLEPKILLLDEPFSALDAHLRVRLREELRVIQRRLAQTTVFVTHDQEEALTLADRIVIMNHGRIEQVGTPAAVYDHPQTVFVADFIGAMNRVPARLEAGVLLAAPWRLDADGLDGTGDLDLAVRPEDIELIEAGADADATGRIEQVIDLGPMRQAQIVCGEGRRVKVQLARQIPIRSGETVGLRLHRALVYRNGTDPVEIHPHQGAFGTVLPFRRGYGFQISESAMVQ